VNHVVGNPFRPISAKPGGWPSPITDLARCLYSGEPCAFALHDALLERGDTDLAEHFQTPDHPKRCWAVDVIMVKK
jgi:hypothetical protein